MPSSRYKGIRVNTAEELRVIPRRIVVYLLGKVISYRDTVETLGKRQSQILLSLGAWSWGRGRTDNKEQPGTLHAQTQVLRILVFRSTNVLTMSQAAVGPRCPHTHIASPACRALDFVFGGDVLS